MHRFLIAALALVGTAHAETLIVGNKAEHTVSFIDLATGEEVARRETGKHPHEIVTTPDGKTAVVVSYRGPDYTGNSLHLFDVAGMIRTDVTSLGSARGPHGLKWIPGTDKVIVTTEATQNVVILDPLDERTGRRVATDQQGSHMVAVAPDAGRAYVANIGSGSFTVIDLKRNRKVTDVKAGDGTEAIAVTPDGSTILVGNNGSKSVMLFDAMTLQQTAAFDTPGVPIRVEVHPDGESLAVSHFDIAEVHIYDMASLDRTATIKLAENSLPVTMLYGPEGKRLWVAATREQMIYEIDTSTNEITRKMKAGEGSDGLGYSPITLERG
ncbi:YncE family protein [Parvularcula sp. ZS-1/3]|uniref:YncE family protein n=1 Tax=Parvularcula mediterranea TaxID=2732508 RepID=A0A7Y3RK24_9PROT|nr:YncE family protein [Parvularcula mediterranea]NNU15513.1 YncE family protein [Parvularcula mediterranea]